MLPLAFLKIAFGHCGRSNAVRKNGSARAKGLVLAVRGVGCRLAFQFGVHQRAQQNAISREIQPD